MHCAVTAESTARRGEEAPGEARGDALRANTYSLLAALFAAPPREPILERLRCIDRIDEADEVVLGPAWTALRQSGEGADVATLDDEYHDLFIGLGRGELVPYGSWYMTGFMLDQPLAVLREDLKRLGFERQKDVKEPEDHVAALLETMALLISEGEALPTQARFFERHMATWMKTFFLDLQQAKTARFYRAVGQFGEKFMDLEQRYLTMLA